MRVIQLFMAISRMVQLSTDLGHEGITLAALNMVLFMGAVRTAPLSTSLGHRGTTSAALQVMQAAALTLSSFFLELQKRHSKHVIFPRRTFTDVWRSSW